MSQSAVIHEEFVYSGHNAVINAVCYNRVQGCFVSCDDASLRLWQPTKTDVDLRQVALPPRTSAFLQAIAFIDSRQIYVASALDGSLRLFDAELNELATVFAARSVILSIAFDSLHSRVYTGGVDGCAAWSVRGKPLVGNEVVLNPQYDFAAIPAFFHHGTGPLSPPSPTKTQPSSLSSKAMTTTIISTLKPPPQQAAAASKKRALRAHEIGWVQSMQLNAEHTRVYAQGKHRVDVFTTADGQRVDSFTGLVPPENGAITAFVVHEKTQYLLCGCLNGFIFVVSVHPHAIVHVFKEHTMAVTGLAVHQLSHLILSSSLDGTVRLWDLEARRQAHRLDIRQPVHAIGILPPHTNPCRFYCRVRCAVHIFTIRSAAKEQLSSLSPISVLQRVLWPTAMTVGMADGVIPGEKHSSTRRVALTLTSTTETSANEEEDGSDAMAAAGRQWIAAAGTDRTIRLYTGRAANEAPSFTWIPEEHALDVTGFSVHPVGKKLMVLLESQKLLVVDIRKLSEEEENESESSRRRHYRLIDMDAQPSLLQQAHAVASSQPQLLTKSASVAAAIASSDHRHSSSGSSSGGNVAASPSLRGAVVSVCCCYYPPLFRSSAPSAAVGDAAAQLKWFSRTFINRRQQSKRDLKRVDTLGTTNTNTNTIGTTSNNYCPTAETPAPLVQSDKQWVVCGSEFGHLIFWHSGLTNSFQEAIALDAHDAKVVAISASASSPLLVSLDAAKRVHVWQLQPLFTLRQMVELGDSPTCFSLAPTAELLLTGYEDGGVVLMSVGESVETLGNPSADDSHDAMVSAGDFLDAKQILLTASVDAVIKIWDHHKNLLRQLQIAMAVTCLCFMNDDGDVMAGVPTGIFMLSKDDLLPEHLPTASPPASREQRRLPLWLAGEDERGGISSVSVAAAAVSVTVPPQQQQQTHHAKATVRFEDDDVESKDKDEGEPSAASRVENEPVVSTAGSWKRRGYKESLALLMNESPTAASASRPPVLRPVQVAATANQSTRATPPTAQRPPSSRILPPAKDPDWRDVIMPASPFHNLPRQESSRHSRRHRLQTPSGARSMIAELKALVPTSMPRIVSPRQAAEATVSLESPPPTLAIGLKQGESKPMEYCKHQAPVPPKTKTPRKLWNAIGGEDRRLIAVQRNLPSI